MAVEDRKMRRVYIGIDSSENIRYSMIAAGSEEEMNILYESMVALLKERNVKVIHYKEIDKKIIKSLSRHLASLINDSKTISFLILEHKKPFGEPSRRYFLEYVPQKIAEHLESFDDKNRLIQIDVHDDYRVPGVPESTKAFMDSLIRKTTRQLSRDNSGIKILPNGKSNFESSKIVSKNRNYIKIRIRSSSRNNSKSINIADMALGFFKEYRTLVNRKIKFRKI